MDERTPLELEDRLTGVAVAPVLAHRILRRLPGERILELHRRNGNAVQVQRQIERLLRPRGETELAGESEPVGRVARFELRVQLVGRLEKRRVQRPPVALEAVAQRRKRAVLIHPLAQICENLLAGSVTMERPPAWPTLSAESRG